MEDRKEDQPHHIVGQGSNPIIGQIWHLAEPLCLGEGMELIHVEFQREQGGRTLRLYIDKPGGITLDDCAQVSRQLGDLLDVKLETAPPYRLEISSPGLDRPLGRLSDFDNYIGQRVKIRTGESINGQKRFTGILKGIEGTGVRLHINQQPLMIPFEKITKAQVMGSDGA